MASVTHGAYHSELANEISRMLKMLEEIGIRDATKIEATALIAEKNKRAKMTKSEVFKFFEVLRGLK